MNIDELLEILDIESTEDFMYFEQFSELVEYSDEIEYDLFAEVLENTIPDNLADMTQSFFDDLISGIPDDNTDLYSLMNDERELLVSLAEASHNHRERALYIDELFNFRNWYIFSESTICRCLTTDVELTTSVYDALVLYRLEKMSGDKYDYDFSDALSYEPDEYALRVVEEINENSYNEDNNDFDKRDDYDIINDYYESDYDCGEQHDHVHEQHHVHEREINPYTEGLVDRDNPVIDGVDYGD